MNVMKQDVTMVFSLDSKNAKDEGRWGSQRKGGM